MSLASGTRFGPYEILVPIGTGGMGEVYKARDTCLNRDIALKVLPIELAIDAKRSQRFEQEARTASALNHPNIVSVFDVGKVGDTYFIVTEFVNGESLRSVIRRGPIPIRQLLDLATQMADGLAAAHAAAIIHRDVKPDNVMVMRDGMVKLLDFGLARSIEIAPERNDSLQAAAAKNDDLKESVQDACLTDPDTLLGTPPYISPEQARGSTDLDGRSDQFSFGVVLYELATGRKAFDKPSTSSTLAALISEEPPQLPNTMPMPIRWLIERCMAKDPADRYESTRDLFLELRHLRDSFLEMTTASQATFVSVTSGSKRRRKLAWLWTLPALLTLSTMLYLRLSASSTRQPTFERLTYRRGTIHGARFGPDSQTVYFGAQWGNEPSLIFSMRVGRRESRPLDLPAGRVLSISSAGEMAILLGLGVQGVPGTLARVPISGGAPREVLENVIDACWSPDGTKLAVSRIVEGKNRVEYPIGTVRYENEGRPPWSIHVSPKGDLIAFFEYDAAVGDFAVSVLDLEGRKRILSRAGLEGSNTIDLVP